MELHAFERMAQSMDVVLVPPCMDEDSGLLPQPMTAFPEQTPPAMAYVPYQMWDAVCEPEEGLARGTMFPVLDKPFHGAEGGC